MGSIALSKSLQKYRFAYYNYKQRFSIVLLVICNSNYEFLIIDVESSGCHHGQYSSPQRRKEFLIITSSTTNSICQFHQPP
ncbi:hypothetical protein EB796_002508 [Bugula neritina]|uniref:Uncharacterized protein n=1 Tax=Bugula neritina TaxID=10212 RepID=A0A7J7KLZ0_BUGNE|nr:hypothetical protein EB796_002508 [Bugula neritina]